MSKINTIIRDNYSDYLDLLESVKISSDREVILDKIKQNHPNTRMSSVLVRHNRIQKKISLIVESKILNKKDFKFKLRAAEVFKPPFFRFDSAGVPHRNNFPDIPLQEQKVDTPHFHRFDETGREVAYRTGPLNVESEREALLNDISLCMAHYCDESQTYYIESDYITVIQTPPGTIDFDQEVENPLEGMNYE